VGANLKLVCRHLKKIAPHTSFVTSTLHGFGQFGGKIPIMRSKETLGRDTIPKT
jgi:hypothetical protein